VAEPIRIARCRREHVPALMAFIDRRWRAGHVLSRDRTLLEWQYDPGLVAHGSFGDPTIQLAWRGDAIVGMLGLTGFVFNIAGAEHPGVWLSIWYVGRECRGHNVALGLIGSVRDLGYEVMGGLGANEVAVPVFRALRFEVMPRLPRWVAVFDVQSTSRLLTSIGDRSGANALPAWCSRHRVAPGSTTSAEVVEVVSWTAHLADTWDALWRSHLAPGLVGTTRDASYLRRRYVEHPRFTYEVRVALERRSGAALGCTVFRIEQIRGREERVLRIVEFMALPEAEACLADALLGAGYESGVSYADFYCSSARFARGLERVGFVLEQRNSGSPRLPSRLSPPEGAHFTMSAVLRSPLSVRGRVDELRQAGRLYLTKSDGDQDRPN
jgi:hypothetical protein